MKRMASKYLGVVILCLTCCHARADVWVSNQTTWVESWRASGDAAFYTNVQLYGDVTLGRWDTGDALVNHWTLNDNASSSTVEDDTGNANVTFVDPTGNPHTSSHDVSGRVNGALSFDGVDDLIDASAGRTNLLDGRATVSLWVRTTAPGASNALGAAISYSKASSAYPGFVIQRGDTGYQSKLMLYIVNSSNTSAVAVSQTQPLASSAWVHVVAAIGGGEYQFWINGKLERLGTYVGPIPSAQIDRITIGAVRFMGTTTFHWKGEIDDVRLYNRILLGPEIEALYNAGAGTEAASGDIPGVTLSIPPGGDIEMGSYTNGR